MTRLARSTFPLFLLLSLSVVGRLAQAARPLNTSRLPSITSTALPDPVYLPLVLNHYPPFFALQNGGPFYIQNFANTAGCNWMGIAGQAFDLNNNPLQNLIVHLEGGGLNYDVITGSPQFSAYGPAGYELYLGNRPIDTMDMYWIQVRGLAGLPLSDLYVIPTFADCRKNLIVANFIQVR